MKKATIILALAMLAISASAERLWLDPSGGLHARLPSALHTDTGVIYPAPQSAFADAGWRLETDAEAAAREAEEEAARHSQPLSFTKRDLCKVLDAAGFLTQFRAVLAADEQAAFWWETCVELATDDPDFMAAVSAMKSALGVTDAEVRALCEAAAGW